MDTNHPQFETYQKQFEELAFVADDVDKAPSIGDCQHYLCLYGENGLTPDEEFELLKKMDAFVGENLKKVVVETTFWQDTVLFVP